MSVFSIFSVSPYHSPLLEGNGRPFGHCAVVDKAHIHHHTSYSSNPSPSAWEAARDILGYLNQTANYSLWIKKGAQPPIQELQISQYCDASFATGSKGRSITGAITLLGSTLLS